MSTHRKEERWKTCDRCGRSDKDHPGDWGTSWPLISEFRYAIGQNYGGTTIGPYDFCGRCTTDFQRWLSGGAS